MVYIHNGILLSHKKEWNLAICNNMDGQGGYYAKWNKSDREKQILYNFTYMWQLKFFFKWKNITKQKQTHTENKQVVARLEGVWGMSEIGKGDQEIQNSSYNINKSWEWNV